jgi:phage gp45-like
MSHRDSTDHARETSASIRGFKGMIRRLLVTLADASTRWQVKGVYGSSAGDEIFQAELFPGIGIFARPPANGSPEAVLASPGGNPKAGVIVATRDEATRKLIASQVGPSETCIYNDVAMVIIKSDGTITAKSINGAGVALATKADIDAMRLIFNAHVHPGVTAGGASTTASVTPMAPNAGTSKFRAE